MSVSKFPNLLSPGKIGKLELKNRMVMAPMGTRFCTDDGLVTDRTIGYYTERAKGGVALIVIEGTNVFHELRLLYLGDDDAIPGMRRLTEAIHAEGIPVVTQLALHRGMRDKANPLAPSVLPVPETTKKSRAITVSEIKEMVERFGETARRAREAGFDGIQVHGGHGYLISNFLSPWTNKRTDEYGGDVRGRARLSLELVEAARKKAGADYPIIFRLMADEKLEGGFTLKDGIAVSKLLEKAGVAAIDVVAGSAATDESDEWITPPMNLPQASNAPLSEAIKREIKIPVMVAGKINDPYIAEDILKTGKADFIDLARALIADPQFPRKVIEGRVEDIRKCICCLKCREAIATAKPVVCSVNPAAGRENEIQPRPARKKKNVLVVGGGPAGIEAAIMSSQRGHKVTLWEQDEELGGQLRVALIPPGKDILTDYLEYLKTQIAKSDVKVELKKKATSAAVLKFSPDAVILATGSSPVVPRIEGMKNREILTSRDVLTGKAKVGQRVVIIGGGYIGCEVADFLTDQGKDVTIVEILEELVKGVFSRVRRVYLKSLSERKIKTFAGVKSEKITDSGVEIVDREGEVISLPADTIVVSTGASPDEALSKSLKGKVPEICIVGDCVKARAILEATREGAEAALKV